MTSKSCENCMKTERELARAFRRLDAIMLAARQLDDTRNAVLTAETHLASELHLTETYLAAL